MDRSVSMTFTSLPVNSHHFVHHLLHCAISFINAPFEQERLANKQPYNCYFTNRLRALGRQNRVQTQELSRLHHQRLLRDENDLHVGLRADGLQRVNVLQRQQIPDRIIATSSQRARDLLNGTSLRLRLVQHGLRLTMGCSSFQPIPIPEATIRCASPSASRIFWSR